MGKDEKIILALGFLGVAAILLFNMKGNFPDVPTPEEVENEYIPASYLTYNQPYMFAPPVANIMPTIASGQLGQAFNTMAAPFDCGCA